MFTHKDIATRTIFVLNCMEHTRSLRVMNGELMLEEFDGNKKSTLTKFPFQKILALFVIGHITVTTPLIDKCRKHGVALVVMKPNLRPVFFFACSAEANYLLRKRQYDYTDSELSVARSLMISKFNNQKTLLEKTRRRDELTIAATSFCASAVNKLKDTIDYNGLMGLEGQVVKFFFHCLLSRFWLEGTPSESQV